VIAAMGCHIDLVALHVAGGGTCIALITYLCFERNKCSQFFLRLTPSTHAVSSAH